MIIFLQAVMLDLVAVSSGERTRDERQTLGKCFYFRSSKRSFISHLFHCSQLVGLQCLLSNSTRASDTAYIKEYRYHLYKKYVEEFYNSIF